MAKYKVGDKVKYVGNGDVFEHGEILTVKADDGSPFLPVLISKGNVIQWVAYGEVKRYKSKKSRRIKTLKQKISTLESQVAELQAVIDTLKKAQDTPKFVPVTTKNIAVGDKIRVIEADEISGGIDLISGKIYEVNYVYSDGDFEIIDEVGDEVVVECCQPPYVEKVVSE